jgi:riboflavin synthase
MYTGITRGTFPVVLLQRKPDLLRYAVALGAELLGGLELGASVSIDGVCQTVVAVEGPNATFEAIHETLAKTTLGQLQLHEPVSVERSARLGDEVGGHELAGHVIGTGTIEAVHQSGDVHTLRIGVPGEWMKYILPKGFIAVNGSSLTVGQIAPDGSFEVHLIPETLRRTRLGHKRSGDRVNIELDARTVAIVDTVERVLAARELHERSE